ncbi:RNA polymerase sigma factor [Sorangium sp. So ce134]
MIWRGPHVGPARVLTIAEIAEQTPYIRGALQGLGVSAVDLDDVTQDVLFGAWTSSQAGRYCPDPSRDPDLALKRWLLGVCFNTSSHYRERAYRRREVPVADPWAAASDERVDAGRLGERLDAAHAFADIFSLPFWAREVLVLAALGYGSTEIGRMLGISVNTAASRLRLARKRLGAKLRRRR